MKKPQPSRATTELVAHLLAQAHDPALGTLSLEDLSRLVEQVGSPQQESNGARAQRWQDRLIEEHIPQGATVLDLGCGSGELLHRLMQVKGVQGQGIELDSEAVFQCVERGVPVFQSDLDLGLKGFADQSFDFVVLEETLQTLHRPMDVLGEMLRVGRHGIVSFPNFGYWRVRLSLALGGRMPVTRDLPYRWWDTPNIHLFTLQDFLDWAAGNGVHLADSHVLADGKVRQLQSGDNVHAEEVLVIVEDQKRRK